MAMSDDRAIRALTDVTAVERVAPGMVRVVTWSDAYVVDARGDGCNCPDKQYNEPTMCKHEWAAQIATTDLPGHEVDDSLQADNSAPRLMTDGGGMWTVVDHANDGNAREFGSREDAEQAAETCRDLGGDPEIFAPGTRPEDEPTTDGGTAEVVDVEPTPEPMDADPDDVDLPERSVSDDPLRWMPGEFVDTIDGSQAINRKGFEVLSHFYDVSTTSTLEVPPEETDHEYCRVKASAEMDGRTVEAFGSAHVDRGDDKTLLLEMADTRARKRALSIITGVGAVAVAELRNEVDR